MGKKHFRSDFSEQESHFFTEGQPIIGEKNIITDLFRLVGKFSKLLDKGREFQIEEYNPDTDYFFIYENAGITMINKRLKEKHIVISRKYLRNISRKWSPSQVVLSFKTDLIIAEILSCIHYYDDLEKAFKKYIDDKNKNWDNIMPIQYSFLGTRLDRNGPKHEEAQRIINSLRRIEV